MSIIVFAFVVSISFCVTPRWGQKMKDYHNTGRSNYVSKSMNDWSVDLGKGWSQGEPTQVIIDEKRGVFYTLSFFMENSSISLIGFHLETGDIISRNTYDAFNPTLLGTPLIDSDGNIVFLVEVTNSTRYTGVIGIDPTTGKYSYQNFPPEPVSQAGHAANAISPHSNTLIFQMEKKYTEGVFNVYALDINANKILWSFDSFINTNSLSNSKAVDIMIDEENKAYFFNNSNEIVRVDVVSGTVESRLKMTKWYQKKSLISFHEPVYSRSEKTIFIATQMDFDDPFEIFAISTENDLEVKWSKKLDKKIWKATSGILSEDESKLYFTGFNINDPKGEETKIITMDTKNGEIISTVQIERSVLFDFPLAEFSDDSKYAIIVNSWSKEKDGAFIVMDKKGNTKEIGFGGTCKGFVVDSSDCIYYCHEYVDEYLGLSCNRKCL